MQSQDAGAKGKQMKELTRRAIEKLDAALRDEKCTVRTLKSRAAEAEERERRMTETHAAELGLLQKRLRAAELRSKELQASARAHCHRRFAAADLTPSRAVPSRARRLCSRAVASLPTQHRR
jgi:hypothetical protein